MAQSKAAPPTPGAHTPPMRLMAPAPPTFKRSWQAYRSRFLDPLRIREGLRFWRFDAVDALIGKRLASLDQVEAIVREAQKQNDEGKAGADRHIRELAIQGPELLRRVEAARRIYADLKDIAAKERPLRAKGRR